MTIHNLSFLFLYPCRYAIFGLLFWCCDLRDFCWIRESTLEIVDLCIFVATWSTVYCFWLWFVWQSWVRETFLKIITDMTIRNLCFLPSVPKMMMLMCGRICVSIFLNPCHYANLAPLFLCCDFWEFAKLLSAIIIIHFDLWRHRVRELTLEVVNAMTIHNLSFFFCIPCCYAIFGILFLSCDLWDFCWIYCVLEASSTCMCEADEWRSYLINLLHNNIILYCQQFSSLHPCVVSSCCFQ